MDDMELLKKYAEDSSQAAFSELVRRHVNWVYGVCRRQVGDAELAQDVTQAVFIVLANKAARLPEGTVLSGWLVNTARYASADAIKRRARRLRHERKAAQMRSTIEMPVEPAEADELMPQLDAAMAKLAPADRDALALRFYERRSLAAVGEALGLSEEAAKKRVQRGLEKLRALLGVRAAALSATAVAGVMMTATAEAAPAALHGAVVTAVTTGKAGAALAIAKGAASMMAWAKAEVAGTAVLATALLGTLAGVTVYQMRPRPLPIIVPVAASAPNPPSKPAPVPDASDDSFLLDGGPAFSRRLDRRLLRFSDNGGAFTQFNLVVIATAVAPIGDVRADVSIVHRPNRTAMVISSTNSQLPYAFMGDGVLVMLDDASPGGLVVAEGVAPEVVVEARAPQAERPMCQVSVRAAERGRINVDLASMIEELQRQANGRSYDERFGAVRLSGPSGGGQVRLTAGAAPGTPPVSMFNVSEVQRQAVGVRDIRVDALAPTLPRVSVEMVELLELPVRRIDAKQAQRSLLPPPGTFDNPKHQAAAANLRGLLQRRDSLGAQIGDRR